MTGERDLQMFMILFKHRIPLDFVVVFDTSIILKFSFFRESYIRIKIVQSFFQWSQLMELISDFVSVLSSSLNCVLCFR